MQKILIVDDLKPFIEQEKSILTRSDFKIFTAGSGEEAFRIHNEERMDLIITDLEMPVTPGDMLTMRIRQSPELRKVSIIIICTKKPSDIERCSKCGANSYITRPLNPHELIDRVNSFLNVPYRKDLRVLIKVSVKGSLKNEPFFCSTQDISKSGMLLETERILAKADIITCSFFIPDADRVVSDAEVVRVIKKEHGIFNYGVRFLSLGRKEEIAIDSFILKRSNSREVK